MSTIHRKPRARGRVAAATMLVAGAAVAGVLGSAPPANAAGTYLALAYRQSSPFVRDAHGIGKSRDSAERAGANALQDCTNNGGNSGDLVNPQSRFPTCKVRVVAFNECAAVAASNGLEGWKIAAGTSFNQQLAEQIALANNGGGLIVVSACSW